MPAGVALRDTWRCAGNFCALRLNFWSKMAKKSTTNISEPVILRHLSPTRFSKQSALRSQYAHSSANAVARGFGFRVSGFGLRISGSGLRNQGSRGSPPHALGARGARVAIRAPKPRRASIPLNPRLAQLPAPPPRAPPAHRALRPRNALGALVAAVAWFGGGGEVSAGSGQWWGEGGGEAGGEEEWAAPLRF